MNRTKYFKRSSCFLMVLLLSSIILLFPQYATAEEILLTKLYRHDENARKPSGVLISQPKPADLEIIHLIRSNQMRTLEDYSRWLKQNIYYQKDAVRDRWAAPQATLRAKRGDCEDFTLLNMAVLRVLGYTPKFLTLKKGKFSHAVCAFKTNGYYYWFDNHTLRKSSARTLPELAQSISAEHHYTQILSWDETAKGWKYLYKTS